MPVLISRLFFPLNSGACQNLIFNNDYIFTITFTSPTNLRCVNISNKYNPILQNSLTFNSGENKGIDIIIKDNYAYIVTSTNPSKLLVANISNPNSPTRVTALTFNSGEDNVQNIAIKNNYIYAPLYDRLVTIDISNPSNPVRVNTLTFNTGEIYATSIVIKDNYAYISAYTRLIVVDISNPSNPVRVNALVISEATNVYFNSLSLYDNCVYMISNTNPAKLIIINISNPSNPIKYNSITLPNNLFYTSPKSFYNNYFYIISSYNMLTFDITNPLDLNLIKTDIIDSSNTYPANHLYVQNEFAYTNINNSNGGINIIGLNDSFYKKRNLFLFHG